MQYDKVPRLVRAKIIITPSCAVNDVRRVRLPERSILWARGRHHQPIGPSEEAAPGIDSRVAGRPAASTRAMSARPRTTQQGGVATPDPFTLDQRPGARQSFDVRNDVHAVVHVISLVRLSATGSLFRDPRLNTFDAGHELVCSVAFVLVVELLNTAIEKLADRLTMDHDKQIGRVKDMGSAAVGVALLMAGAFWIISITAASVPGVSSASTTTVRSATAVFPALSLTW